MKCIIRDSKEHMHLPIINSAIEIINDGRQKNQIVFGLKPQNVLEHLFL